jgi:hypothetical protein
VKCEDLVVVVVRPLGFEPRTCGLRVLAQPSFSRVTRGLNCSFARARVLAEARLGLVGGELLPKKLPEQMARVTVRWPRCFGWSRL